MGQGDEHYHDIPAVVLAHIREGKPGFDSVICGNDRIAFMVYQTLLGQGLRIPQDVAVVGYDNMVGIGDLFLPPLSTVQLPHYDIGRLSALHIIHGDNHRETRKVAARGCRAPHINDYRCCAASRPPSGCAQCARG